MGTDVSKDSLFDNVELSKKLLTTLLGFMLGGISLIMLGVVINGLFFGTIINTICIILGYGVFAAPMLMAFVFKVGVFVDIGPMFMETQTRIGNVIYTKLERDHTTEMATNFILTIFKIIILAILAIFLTPIVTGIAAIFYKRSRNKAKDYCEQNGVSENEIPRVNKLLFTVMIAVVIGLFVLAIITNAIGDKIRDNKQNALNEKYAPVLTQLMKDLPTEYIAETIDIYSNRSYNGYAAEFVIDGEHIIAGQLSDNFELKDFGKAKNLSRYTQYYIIDGNVYIRNDDYSSNFIKVTDTEVIEYFNSRHFSTYKDQEKTLIDTTDRLEQLEKHVELDFQTTEKYQYKFCVDAENKLLYYSNLYYPGGEMASAGEQYFKIGEHASQLNEFKEAAQMIIAGTANIQ